MVGWGRRGEGERQGGAVEFVGAGEVDGGVVAAGGLVVFVLAAGGVDGEVGGGNED